MKENAINYIRITTVNQNCHGQTKTCSCHKHRGDITGNKIFILKELRVFSLSVLSQSNVIYIFTFDLSSFLFLIRLDINVGGEIQIQYLLVLL